MKRHNNTNKTISYVYGVKISELASYITAKANRRLHIYKYIFSFVICTRTKQCQCYR